MRISLSEVAGRDGVDTQNVQGCPLVSYNYALLLWCFPYYNSLRRFISLRNWKLIICKNRLVKLFVLITNRFVWPLYDRLVQTLILCKCIKLSETGGWVKCYWSEWTLNFDRLQLVLRRFRHRNNTSLKPTSLWFSSTNHPLAL